MSYCYVLRGGRHECITHSVTPNGKTYDFSTQTEDPAAVRCGELSASNAFTRTAMSVITLKRLIELVRSDRAGLGESLGKSR